MTRIWLALLLAFSLWPSAATASMPAGEPDEIHGESVDYGSHALRSSNGDLGLVLTFESHGPGCSVNCSHRSGSGGHGPLHVLTGSEFILGRARLLADPGVADVDGVVAPLCERLPYFATAPPSSR